VTDAGHDEEIDAREGFVSWVAMGAIAGVLARWTVPDPARLIVTLVLGKVGLLGRFRGWPARRLRDDGL